MPRSDAEGLKPFARCNAVRLTHERFRADTQSLIKALEQVLTEADAARKAHGEAARPKQKSRRRLRRSACAEFALYWFAASRFTPSPPFRSSSGSISSEQQCGPLDVRAPRPADSHAHCCPARGDRRPGVCRLLVRRSPDRLLGDSVNRGPVGLGDGSLVICRAAYPSDPVNLTIRLCLSADRKTYSTSPLPLRRLT